LPAAPAFPKLEAGPDSGTLDVSDPDIKRRLAAILSADVAGYSRLMGVDEEATLSTLGICREVFDRLIARHDGRFVGSAGDSVLAEFASPVEATRCAVAVQHELAARNDELAEERRMRFRIGINLGDVMAKGGDLFGDGVNVAARLEALAEPGGICISGAKRQEHRRAREGLPNRRRRGREAH
jgi:class 3 adenylate cyclase